MAVAKPKIYTYTEAGNLVVAANRAARRYMSADSLVQQLHDRIQRVKAELERAGNRARRARLASQWDALSAEYVMAMEEARALWEEYEIAAMRVRRSGAVDVQQLERVRY